MRKWLPDRKVLTGGVSAVLAFFVLAALAAAGLDLPAEYQTMLPVAIGYAISYLVPPGKRELIERIDDKLVELAANDPRSRVSAEVGRAVTQARNRAIERLW